MLISGFKVGVTTLPLNKEQLIPTDTVPHMAMHYEILTNKDSSYGYDVYVNGKLLVRQPSIPGMAGAKGFLRKADAKKVATLVIKKIQQGLMPPTIVKRELDSLKIKY
jgi:hypothetical protein